MTDIKDPEGKGTPPTDDKGKAPDPPAPAAPPAPGKGDDVKQLKSELDGVHKSAGEWKARAEKAQAALDKHEAEKRKAAEAKAKEAGDFEELLKTRDQELETLKQELDSTKRAAIISEAKSKLDMVKSLNARDRLAEKWAALDVKDRDADKAWDTWLDVQRTDDPATFEAPATPTSSPRAGSPAPAGSTGSSLAERLVAKDARGYPDLETQSAAIAEAKERLARGEPIQ